MDKLVITGGTTLSGEIVVSGAKNAALPILCASLLTADDVHLENVPNLQDVRTMLKLLRQMGVQSEVSSDGRVTLNASKVTNFIAPYEMVKTMRASILVLGPLVARFGEAKVSLPGGCAIGARPVDQHIKGLQAMGAEINIEHGFIEARAKRLKGARIITDMITVTGTENLLMAAVLAEGETVIENAAREPEVSDLAHLLVKMGAKIDGIGSDRLVIHGVEKLHGARHSVVPDRIEAGTFLCAVAATGGDVTLRHVRPPLLDAVTSKAARSGRDDRGRRRLDARQDGEASRSGELPHVGISRVPDRHAGAVHGAQLDGEGHVAGRRDDFREPLHARPGTEPPRREHHHRRQYRAGFRRRAIVGREGDGDRPARVGEPRDRGDVRGRRDADRPHLSPRPRLRPHGSEADGRRREGEPHQGQRERAMSSVPQTSSSVEASAPLTLALSKGRIFEETLPLLATAGVQVAEDPETSRKLILPTTNPNLRVIIVRATDVPTYVEYGAADFGVAGKDVLIEHGGGGLYQPVDLNIARCRMSVAVKAGFDYASAVRQGARLRVATKYVEVAREHFASKGVHVDLIKLYGSMELAPLVGLADAIVDLVSSGGTLRANNLVEVEEIMQISSRLVVNQAALKLKREALKPFLDAFERASVANGN